MQTNLDLLAVVVPVVLVIGAAAIGVVFVAFRVTKLVIKMILMLAALTVLGLAVWWLAGAY